MRNLQFSLRSSFPSTLVLLYYHSQSSPVRVIMPRAFAAVLSLSAAPVFSSLTDVSLLLRVSFGATRMVGSFRYDPTT